MQIFQSTRNTRGIIEGSFRFIRSDVPTQVSEEEMEWLISHGVTTVVDLRTPAERERKRCPLMDDERFSYYCFPILGGDKIPPDVDSVSKSYISMVDPQFEDMIGFLLNSESGVLYFCNAGKDRTGVVSAVLLHKLGMSREYIVGDYMTTRANLETALREFARLTPGVDINVITPHERYIEEFLDWYTGKTRGMGEATASGGSGGQTPPSAYWTFR